MGTTDKLFRSQLSGFNKEDVNKYILEADRRYTEETAALKQELEALREQAEQLTSEKEQLLADKEKLTADLEEKETANEALNSELSAQERGPLESACRCTFEGYGCVAGQEAPV